MDAIFHERQEGLLCAQHCLNNLLQGPYFSAVDLATIARELDEKEREQMAEAGVHTEGYVKFMAQPSNNFDDSGYFSIQVIAQALQVMGLELLPYNSSAEMSKLAKRDPTQMRSYICNFNEHWLTVRKIGNQWFNLNSLLTGPELISDTFLGMFLVQLQQDGYSIFIINGDLSECEADPLLRLCPAVQPIKPQLITERGRRRGVQETAGEDDEGVAKAIAASKRLNETDDVSLQRALQLSMEGYIEESITRMETGFCDTEFINNEFSPQSLPSTSTISKPHSGVKSRKTEEGATVTSAANESDVKSTTVDQSGQTLGGARVPSAETGSGPEPVLDEVRQKRLAYLSRLEKSNSYNDNGDVAKSNSVSSEVSNGASSEKAVDNTPVSEMSQMTEEEMLQQAIAMSMSQQS